MKVKELIDALRGMPGDASVFHLWDGEPRTEISVVYEAKNGTIITAPYGEVCYSCGSRPIGAPSTEDESHWKTEAAPEALGLIQDEDQ